MRLLFFQFFGFLFFFCSLIFDFEFFLILFSLSFFHFQFGLQAIVLDYIHQLIINHLLVLLIRLTNLFWFLFLLELIF